MRISKSGRRAKKDTQTLFPPYFKNKTILVAKDNTHIFNLITLLFICFLHPGGMHRSVEILPQTKITCGAAAVFQVICGNPHVMHKDISFLPIFCPYGTECQNLFDLQTINNKKALLILQSFYQY
jgi:hypothetical protein